MSFGEARDFLLLHRGGGARPGAWHDGRLGPLRPSGGRLDGAYFHEVMAAVAAVAPHLRHETRLDRTLVAALWDLCELARRWGQEPDAMRRRNGVGSDADASAVAGRLQAISDAVAVLLGGGRPEEAFASYHRLSAPDAAPLNAGA